MPKPPKYAERLLCWFLKRELAEEVMGDLDEKFYNTLRKKSLAEAKRNYWYQVLSYCRPFAIKSFRSKHLNRIIMVKNDVKIAWRHLVKQKMYSSIKIGGFALSIAACFLITLYILDELRYDQHYFNKDRIFRVFSEFNNDGDIQRDVWFPAPLAQVLREDFAEIEKVGRYNSSELFGAGGKEVRRADRQMIFFEKGFTYMDQELFDILQYRLVSGNPGKVLEKPNDLVISQRKAEKYFPNEDPLGKTLVFNNDEEEAYTIRGVMENPEAMHFQYDFFMSLEGVEFWPGEQNYWGANNYPTYIMLREGADPKTLEEKLEAIKENYLIPSWKEGGDLNVDENAKKYKLRLQPVADIHLKSNGIRDALNHSDIRFVWLFGAVALFILIIATINFINLSTAKSANRAKEVGLRKTVGSTQGRLVSQFLVESLIYSFFSFAIGILLAYILLPYFNLLSTKSLVIPWSQWWMWPGLFSCVLVIGILAGLYPSFYLSSFKPIHVLKGKVSRGSRSSSLRDSLVVFQFTTSIVLIIATFTIYKQVNYIMNRKVGFDKEQVILVKGTHTLQQDRAAFKNKLLTLSSVQGVTTSDFLPLEGSKRNNNGFFKAGKRGEEEAVYGQIWNVDHDYISTLGMDLLEGRDFTESVMADSNAMIINQKMARAFGFENAVGEKIDNGDTWTVIGVIDDFHFESMKDEIRPLCLVLGESPGTMSIKVATDDLRGTLKAINGIWDELAPHQPIRYSFMDEDFASMYADMERTGKIFGAFAILAVIIACLGLFALSAFMVEQRGKEISIRLVLGASIGNILKLLTSNFVKLISVSFVIAAPIAWYFMQNWLEDFTYRTEMGIGIFTLAGVLSIVIALITICSQSIRAALANPVERLRLE